MGILFEGHQLARAAQSLHPALEAKGVRSREGPRVPHQRNGASSSRVASAAAFVVLGDAAGDIFGYARVQRAVAAPDHVDVPLPFHRERMYGLGARPATVADRFRMPRVVEPDRVAGPTQAQGVRPL